MICQTARHEPRALLFSKDLHNGITMASQCQSKMTMKSIHFRWHAERVSVPLAVGRHWALGLGPAQSEQLEPAATEPNATGLPASHTLTDII